MQGRARTVLVAVFLTVLASSVAIRYRTFVLPRTATQDFVAYYRAAVQLQHGASPYPAEVIGRPVPSGVSPELPGDLPVATYVNPPLFGQLLAPLTRWDIYTSARLWYVLQFILGGLLVIVLAQCVGPESRLPVGMVLCLVLVWGAPFRSEVRSNQAAHLPVILLAGSALALIRGHPSACGALLGLATAFKLWPGVLVVSLLSGRRWRAVAALCLSCLVLFVVSGLLSGFEHWWDLFRHVLPYTAAIAPLAKCPHANQSITGALTMLGRPLGLTEEVCSWTRACSLLLSGVLFLAAASGVVAWREGAGGEELLREWGLLAIAALVSQPCSYPYHYMALLMPAAGMVPALLDRATGRTPRLLGWLALVCAHAMALDIPRLGRLLAYPQLVGSLGMFAWLMWFRWARSRGWVQETGMPQAEPFGSEEPAGPVASVPVQRSLMGAAD